MPGALQQTATPRRNLFVQRQRRVLRLIAQQIHEDTGIRANVHLHGVVDLPKRDADNRRGAAAQRLCGNRSIPTDVAAIQRNYSPAETNGHVLAVLGHREGRWLLQRQLDRSHAWEVPVRGGFR